jgi:hypothetical protein
VSEFERHILAIVRDRLTDARREIARAAPEPCSTVDNRLIDALIATADAVDSLADLVEKILERDGVCLADGSRP